MQRYRIRRRISQLRFLDSALLQPVCEVGRRRIVALCDELLGGPVGERCLDFRISLLLSGPFDRPTGRSEARYEKIYCARGQAENYIKSWKRHLASDRTSCSKANANQMRLVIHHCAYWLMWTLRAACPKRSLWRRAQFDTLRLYLIRIAATVVEKKTRIIMSLPASCPQQSLIRLLFEGLAPPHSA